MSGSRGGAGSRCIFMMIPPCKAACVHGARSRVNRWSSHTDIGTAVLMQRLHSECSAAPPPHPPPPLLLRSVHRLPPLCRCFALPAPNGAEPPRTDRHAPH